MAEYGDGMGGVLGLLYHCQLNSPENDCGLLCHVDGKPSRVLHVDGIRARSACPVTLLRTRTSS
jgi:hypothetical protein